MKYIKELEQLAQLPYFNQVTIGNLLGLSGPTLQVYISRCVARGQLIRLKRGIYVSSDYYKLETDKQGYLEFLSSVIYGPSYLSLEYVLQKYAILTESVFAYSAISVKKTKKIINKLGSYLYTNIKKERFEGFEITKRGRYEIRQATKAKALYDYFYFAAKPWKQVTQGILAELRLNLDEMKPNDWIEFSDYIDKWGGYKLKNIKKIICNQ